MSTIGVGRAFREQARQARERRDRRQKTVDRIGDAHREREELEGFIELQDQGGQCGLCGCELYDDAYMTEAGPICGICQVEEEFGPQLVAEGWQLARDAISMASGPAGLAALLLGATGGVIVPLGTLYVLLTALYLGLILWSGVAVASGVAAVRGWRDLEHVPERNRSVIQPFVVLPMGILGTAMGLFALVAWIYMLVGPWFF